MICSKCSTNNATIHFKRINNGVIENISMCSSCYNSQNSNILYNQAKISERLQTDQITQPEPHACDMCGTNLQQITSTANVGCEYCYKTFKQQLYQIIENYHNTKINGGFNE